MKKYNVPQMEMLLICVDTDIIRTSATVSNLSIKASGEGNKWTVSQTPLDG